jgi:hypothetical protein
LRVKNVITVPDRPARPESQSQCILFAPLSLCVSAFRTSSARSMHVNVCANEQHNETRHIQRIVFSLNSTATTKAIDRHQGIETCVNPGGGGGGGVEKRTKRQNDTCVRRTRSFGWTREHDEIELRYVDAARRHVRRHL